MDFLRLFFPPRCIFCRAILYIDAKDEICENCREQIPFMDSPIIPVSEDAELVRYCSGVVCLCHYMGNIKEALVRYKFSNKPSYSRTLGRLLARKIRSVLDPGNIDAVIAVPLHWRRQRTRGYNQSRLIAREIARELGLEEKSNILRRIRSTDAQSRLGRSRRLHNVYGAFKVVKAENIQGKTVLLVDDILTTGSTVGECSRVLMEAGAAKVMAAVVASGRSDQSDNRIRLV